MFLFSNVDTANWYLPAEMFWLDDKAFDYLVENQSLNDISVIG
jgi:hypothetical protein